MKPTDTIGDDIRLYRGDCLAVLPTLAPGSVDAVVTDPPYGMAYQSAWRTDKQDWFPKIANDEAPYVWWLPDAFRVLKPGGCLVCFCRWDSAEAFRLAIGWAGFRVVTQLVWDRVIHGMGDLNGSPSPQHDAIWFAVKGKYALPGSRPCSVYRRQRLGGEELDHPNQKPVPLMKDLVTDYTSSGDLILDPFVGSGATGIACQQSGRRFIGIELDPTHYATALRRLTHAAGKAADQLFSVIEGTP